MLNIIKVSNQEDLKKCLDIREKVFIEANIEHIAMIKYI